MTRRAIAWLAGAAGLGVVLYRRLRRRPPEPEAAAGPAEELRRKLDESRAAPSEPVAPEPEPAPPEPAEPSVAERRRGVHERGRAAIDAMRDRAAGTSEPGDPGQPPPPPG